MASERQVFFGPQSPGRNVLLPMQRTPRGYVSAIVLDLVSHECFVQHFEHCDQMSNRSVVVAFVSLVE